MAIEDLGYSSKDWRTGHAPSRVRSMLRGLHAALQSKRPADRVYQLIGGATRSGRELIPEIEEALAEWSKLDDLLIQVNQQRQHIASRLSPLVSFYVAVHGQVLLIDRKKRSKMTPAKRILFAAKLRETRRLRGTLGKRQKQRLKAQAEGLTVTVTAAGSRVRSRGP